MKKILLAGLALLLLLVLGGAAVLVVLVGRLNTPEFKQSLLDAAKSSLGTEVRVKEMDISLLSGVTLEGVAVANPAPFSGDLLTADEFVLRYRLRPLLAGRVEVERLALVKPVLSLQTDAHGVFNYEKLGREAPGAAAPAGAATAPLRIVLRHLGVEDASVVMTDHRKARLLSVEGARFRSAFDVQGGVARGSGDATVATVNAADLLFVRDVRAPLTVSKEVVTLGPVRGKVAGGQVSGDVTVHLEGGFRYVANLEVQGAQVETLLAEAKSAGGVSGALQGKASFEGAGGMATLKGRGEAVVTGCRVEHARVLALLSEILKVPELANPDFSECRVEFVQAGSRVATPILSLKGDAVQLAGKGHLDVEKGTLEYTMNLALAEKLFAKVTRPELRGAFHDRGDGFATVDFRLYGTTADPKTDLLTRLGRAAATSAAKEQVNRLLKKKIF